MVDLLTNQKLTWQQRSMGDDGRVFESKPLDQSDDPELLQEVSEARAALIEQVHVTLSSAKVTQHLDKEMFFHQYVFLFPITGC